MTIGLSIAGKRVYLVDSIILGEAMRNLVAAVIVVSVALSSLPARAEKDRPSPVEAWEFGLGTSSCAVWLTDQMSELYGVNWILGYWSGLNTALRMSVGKGTDSKGIVAEIKKICQKEPSKLLDYAVTEFYVKMRSQGR